eukprot:TRINITY_DN3342_c0_g3_i1.p3 TRINITY_DN3342_c0_g3~~TRINITY_DN3342_c0_g3_i1.p3  ORF type:complete len:134 (-),score=16.44 TRINITY_DN3342_c0_g3_i1:325-726(-)
MQVRSKCLQREKKQATAERNPRKGRKEPRGNPMGMRYWNRGAAMASPCRSSATDSQALRANSCNFQPHCHRLAHAGSICVLQLQLSQQKPAETEAETQAHRSSVLSESPSSAPAAAYSSLFAISRGPLPLRLC